MDTDYLILITDIFFTCVTFVVAKRKGRNAILWSFIAAASFLAMVLSVSGGISFIIGFGEGREWSEEVFDNYELYRLIVASLVGAVTNCVILLYVSKHRNQSSSEPPPPPTFE